MNWKNLLLGGAIISAFSLGAMVSPIGKSEATTESNKPNIIQTAAENSPSQAPTDNYSCPITGQAMGNGAGMGHYFAGSMANTIAETLGITIEEFQTALREGNSVADLAQEKNISINDLKNKLIQVRTAELKQLVSEGSITQAQMDAMIANMDSMVEAAIKNNGVGHMNGHSGGMGMMGYGVSGHMNGGNQNLY